MDEVKTNATEVVEVDSNNKVSDKKTKKILTIIGIIILVILATIICFVVIVKFMFAKKIIEVPTDRVIINLDDKNEDNEEKTLTKYDVVFPFIRDDNIYLYNKGEEELLVSPASQTTETNCYNLTNPLISPDKKYVAYIDQAGEKVMHNVEMAECGLGILKIVNLTTREVLATDYKVYYYGWNNDNKIELEDHSLYSLDDENSLPENANIRFVVFDASKEAEIASQTVSYSDVVDRIFGFPLFGTEKSIIFKNDKFYLINETKKENFVIGKAEVRAFEGFSPDGKYALFSSNNYDINLFEDIWYLVDTTALNAPQKELRVKQGAGGGELYSGLKWLFNEGFVSYCSGSVTFLDGSERIILQNEQHGGCYNEDGFVTTSWNNKYAILAFEDHYELRTAEGEIQEIEEKEAETIDWMKYKNNFYWLDDDFAIISRYTTDINFEIVGDIYIFDRQNNVIDVIVRDGYILDY